MRVVKAHFPECPASVIDLSIHLKIGCIKEWQHALQQRESKKSQRDLFECVEKLKWYRRLLKLGFQAWFYSGHKHRAEEKTPTASFHRTDVNWIFTQWNQLRVVSMHRHWWWQCSLSSAATCSYVMQRVSRCETHTKWANVFNYLENLVKGNERNASEWNKLQTCKRTRKYKHKMTRQKNPTDSQLHSSLYLRRFNFCCT